MEIIMKTKKTYAVFGLGRYGTAVARELVENGMEVIAVDAEERIVNDAASYLPMCKCADVTDAEVISRLGIGNIDTVIVCMASNLESSVMAITLCKEAGVKTVIAKCSNEMQQKILLRIGADQVVFPENESGVRMAKNILSAGFVDLLEISRDVSMVEVSVQPEWVGKSLLELNLRRKYGINIVAIREGGRVSVTIDPEKPLSKEARLLVIGNPARMGKLK